MKGFLEQDHSIEKSFKDPSDKLYGTMIGSAQRSGSTGDMVFIRKGSLLHKTKTQSVDGGADKYDDDYF